MSNAKDTVLNAGHVVADKAGDAVQAVATGVNQAAEVVKGLAALNTAFTTAYPYAIGLAATDPAAFHKLEEEFLTQYKYKARGNVADVLSRRPLASIDLAVAQSWYFPDQTFASNRAGRTGVWLTGNVAAGFRQNAATTQKGYFSLYLIGRYMTDRTLANTAVPGEYLDIDYIDGGGKLELELSRLSFSYEAVWRDVSGADQNKNPTVGSGWRSVGNIKYRIGEHTFITGAFGKNFGIRNNLLYTLGINWNIQTGTEQAVAP